MSDARFHPSGTKVVATKWHFSSRSLGAGEGWEYSIPESSEDSVEAGRGKRLVGRTLPVGWGPEDYGDQQIGPEQFIWQGEDAVIYAKNVIDTNGQWTYSKGTCISSFLANSSLRVDRRCSFWNLCNLLDQPDLATHFPAREQLSRWR